MPAPKGNKNAVGNTGGKTVNDRQLAAEVRSLALGEIKKILDQDGLTEMKKQILLKIAPSLLPRLNEHTGDNGDPIEQRIIYLPQRDAHGMETSPRETDRGSANNT